VGLNAKAYGRSAIFVQGTLSGMRLLQGLSKLRKGWTGFAQD